MSSLQQLLSFKSNPFSWDESAKSVKSTVLDFELKDANGTHLNVTGLSKEIEIVLPLSRQPDAIDIRAHFVKPSSNESSNMRYHIISIPGKEYAVSVRVVPLKDVNLTIYVRYNGRPTTQDYNFTAVVPDFTSCTYVSGEGYTNCSSDPHAVVISSAITGYTGLHYLGIRFDEPKEPVPRPESRKRRDCSSHNGRRKRSCVGVKDPPTTMPPTKVTVPPYNATTDVNYTMTVTMATCLYFNVLEKWVTQGCRVGRLSLFLSLKRDISDTCRLNWLKNAKALMFRSGQWKSFMWDLFIIRAADELE